MRNKKKCISLTLAAVLLLTGCGGGTSNNNSSDTSAANSSSDTSAASTGDKKVLTFGCQMYTDGIVNTVTDENGGWNAMRYGITEGLFKFNDSMEVEPWLAESYTVNDEHTEWVITLKDGIKFSDGCDLTPTKVKEYFEYLKEMGPSGSAKPQKYLEFEATVTADDEANTLTIQTTQPYANLPGQLAHPTMGIVDVADTENFDNGTIGTGPYMIDTFNGVGVGYDLVANPNYREEVPYDEVKLMYMGDASAKTMALQSGQVDLVENITNVSDIQDFKDNPDFTVDIASGVRCGFSWMNFDGILGNKTLRQAILMGIDYDTICNSKTIGGLYTPGFSVLPSTLNYGYDKLTNPYTYDPEGAKAILEEAGYKDTDGDGFVETPDGDPLTLDFVIYTSRAELGVYAQAAQASLKEIGINVNLNTVSYETLLDMRDSGQYDLLIWNVLVANTGDPENYLRENWYSKSANNTAGYNNPEVDELLDELAGTFDEEERKDLIIKIQQDIMDDAATVFFGYETTYLFSNKRVTGVKMYPMDYYWLTKDITLAE